MKCALFLLPLVCATLLAVESAPDPKAIPTAINALGLNLYRLQSQASKTNLLLSPYSIQNALAMTYAGADGETRTEMQSVLHFPSDEESVHSGFAGLSRDLNAAVEASKKRVADAKTQGGPSTALEINVANRLFGQRGFAFKNPFLATLNDRYAAPLDELDFAKASEEARSVINAWVAKETKDKIRDIVPAGSIHSDTRLALANAIYVKAAWANEFAKSATKPAPFLVAGKEKVQVPTMVRQDSFRYEKGDAYAIVAIPYAGADLQFIVILPDAPAGLPALEKSMTPQLLQKCATLAQHDVILYLPKFRLEPEPIKLGSALKTLGMKKAFDVPKGSANFERMAPIRPDDYLKVSEVFHKTWLALDEQGTEAAAATMVVVRRVTSAIRMERPKPIEVKVDHPFLFAIQHVPSGTCLFLGRVTDPR